mmetsp:Transcript_20763/g.62538  ORF Transcript_20763/g.62538 Transcript_20763/m.62538 type:complete len:297 (+) Transcript_20763:187-1077(+)
MRCVLRGWQLHQRSLFQQGRRSPTAASPHRGGSTCSGGGGTHHHAHRAAPHHSLLRRAWLPLAAGATGGLACGSFAAYVTGVYQDSPVATLLPAGDLAGTVPASAPSWVHAFAAREGLVQALNTESLRKHTGPMAADHWFSKLVHHGHLREMTMFYDPQQLKFFCILSLGSDICGFPNIVHGGLTAATFDETFGGLLFALKRQRKLPFWGPAFTAQLDITYRSKIAAGQSILCTAEVESIEGRKVWMRAIMSDGPGGKVYATARALFVAPKPHRLIKDVLRTFTPTWLGGGPDVAR